MKQLKLFHFVNTVDFHKCCTYTCTSLSIICLEFLNKKVKNINSMVDESNSSLNTLMNPAYYMDDYLSTGYATLAALGVPVNLLVAGPIIFLKRLHSPRNIVWLGVGFSNILFLLSFLLEVAYARSEGSAPWQIYFEILSGLPNASLVLNLHLSLLNRYVMLHYPLWYKQNVTNSLIVIGQLCSFLFLFLILKGRFFFNPPKLQKEFSLDKLMSSLVWVIIGMATLFLTFLFSPKNKMEQEDLNANENVSHHDVKEPINTDGNSANKQKDSNVISIHDEYSAVRYQKNVDGPNATKSDTDNSGRESVHFVRIKSIRLSRLDLEAANSILFSAKAYSAFVFPGLVLFGILFVTQLRLISFPLTRLLLEYFSTFVVSCLEFIRHSSIQSLSLLIARILMLF